MFYIAPVVTVPVAGTYEKKTLVNVSETERCSESLDKVSGRKRSGFSPNDMQLFQEPMCLVSFDNENLPKIGAEAIEQISKINWPIVVVSVVGLYRTGKSYLMNCLAQSTRGFVLGNTNNSTTKGIWVWCKIHPEKSNTVLMLLDTEGLGDVDKGDSKYDSRIITLATLLCNYLVYNMKGVFDQDAMSKLSFVTEMAENIRFSFKGKSSDDNNSLNLILPDFVLCLRDFHLKLSDGTKDISEDEYLDSCLAIQKGKDEKFNKPRECITKFFPVRKCFTLPVPGDSEMLQNLETLEFKDLSKSFKVATSRFVSYIHSRQPKELLASKPINGPMFVTLATHYVTAMQKKAVPDVNDAFSVAAKIENTLVEKEAIEMFKTQMKSVTPPVPYRVLESNCTKAQQASLQYLRTNAVHDQDGQCEQQAQMKMDNIFDEVKEKNIKEIQQMCILRLELAFEESMAEKIGKKDYEVTGGHKAFQRDIKTLKEDYFNNLREFEEHEILWIWCQFLETIKQFETTIIDADEDLSKGEKEDEITRNEKYTKDMVEKHRMCQANALKVHWKSLEMHSEERTTDRMKQLVQEKEKYERFLKFKLKEEQMENALWDIEKQQQEKIQKLIEDERRRTEENIKTALDKERKAMEETYNEQIERIKQENKIFQEMEEQQKAKQDELDKLKERMKQLEKENEKLQGLEEQQKASKSLIEQQKQEIEEKKKVILAIAKKRKPKDMVYLELVKKMGQVEFAKKKGCIIQ